MTKSDETVICPECVNKSLQENVFIKCQCDWKPPKSIARILHDDKVWENEKKLRELNER